MENKSYRLCRQTKRPPMQYHQKEKTRQSDLVGLRDTSTAANRNRTHGKVSHQLRSTGSSLGDQEHRILGGIFVLQAQLRLTILPPKRRQRGWFVESAHPRARQLALQMRNIAILSRLAWTQRKTSLQRGTWKKHIAVSFLRQKI